MRKDRNGLCFTFYAVLAFVLAILGQTLLSALLLGFAIVAEQDEWLIRQTMQAFFLCLVRGVITGITGAVSGMWYAIPFVGSFVSGLLAVVSGLISLVVFVFALIGLVHVAGGKDAGLPVLTHFADKAFGLVKTVTYTSPSQSQDPQNPQNPQ